jgi:hypothetical protein
MPTINKQVSANEDDGYWEGPNFSTTATTTYYGGNSMGTATHNYYRWTGVTIPVGAIITSATVSCYDSGSGKGTLPDGTKLYFHKSLNPAAPTNVTQANALVSSATTNWVRPAMSNGMSWFAHPDVKDIIQELVDTYDYSSGSAMMAFIISVAGSPMKYGYGSIYMRDYSGNTRGAKLDITYIMGSLLPRRRSFNSLLVR